MIFAKLIQLIGILLFLVCACLLDSNVAWPFQLGVLVGIAMFFIGYKFEEEYEK